MGRNKEKVETENKQHKETKANHVESQTNMVNVKNTAVS